MIQWRYFTTIAPFHAAELVVDVNDDGLSTRLLLPTEEDYAVIQYFREHSIREVIRKHIEADETDIDRLEGIGALNFLAIDDLLVVEEGEHIEPISWGVYYAEFNWVDTSLNYGAIKWIDQQIFGKKSVILR